jgi:hypothetical protein
MKKPKDLAGCRVLIITGPHSGKEGICIGKAADGKKWAVSPDDSNIILELIFEREFGLLLDMPGDNTRN